MSKIWDERQKGLEEDYFRRKEQEAIERMRTRRAEIEQREGEPSEPMPCPKCDGMLVETVLTGVVIDRCDKCSGVWLDAGELEVLTKQEEESGWARRFWQGLSGQKSG